MKNTPIPFFHPTTVYFIDDSDEFLKSISDIFIANTTIRLQSEPEKALEELSSLEPCKLFEQTQLTASEALDTDLDPSVNLVFDYDISEIIKELYNSSRFQQVSVIIIDQYMPNITGIDLCSKLRNHPAKKILLTGQSDSAPAIAAFNEGLIDKFIFKHESNFTSKLSSMIHELQLDYFSDRCRFILESIKKAPVLNTKEYKAIFNRIASNSVEYYMLDTSGSFLFIESDGKPTFLFIKTKDELDNLCVMAEESGIGQDIVNEIKSRNKLPYFSVESNVLDWGNHLFTALPLNLNGVYYALSREKERFKLDWNKIKLFG